MNRLLEVGFELAGHWLLKNDKLTYELLRHAKQKNILYAFVCDGQVKYVGKSVRTLAVRMSGYRTPSKSQTTNINNHKNIIKHLHQQHAVEIFVLPDNGLLHYGQFHLNLAAALEDDIIRVIDPEWNGGLSEDTGNQSTSTTEMVDKVESSNECQVIIGFDFILQQTYYRTGFFNIGVAYQSYLGADGEKIEIYLDNDDHPIFGSINRRVNQNNTPRIMGGKGLRDWFKSNAAPMSTISVAVLSSTSICLKPK
jgi:hypothetical protein